MIKKVYKNGSLILYAKSNEKVSLENMLGGLDYLDKDHSLPKTVYVLEDATKSTVTFSVEDVSVIIDRMAEVSRNFKQIKHAVIHNSPKNTALAMLIKQNTNADNYTIEIFSSEETALSWLREKSFQEG